MATPTEAELERENLELRLQVAELRAQKAEAETKLFREQLAAASLRTPLRPGVAADEGKDDVLAAADRHAREVAAMAADAQMAATAQKLEFEQALEVLTFGWRRRGQDGALRGRQPHAGRR